jgi:hypothetical protein
VQAQRLRRAGVRRRRPATGAGVQRGKGMGQDVKGQGAPAAACTTDGTRAAVLPNRRAVRAFQSAPACA